MYALHQQVTLETEFQVQGLPWQRKQDSLGALVTGLSAAALAGAEHWVLGDSKAADPRYLGGKGIF